VTGWRRIGKCGERIFSGMVLVFKLKCHKEEDRS
jgi:hypothetical protein